MKAKSNGPADGAEPRMGGKGRIGTWPSRHRASVLIGWFLTLAWAAGGVAAGAWTGAEGPAEKRVERRGTEIQTSASPAGPRPEPRRETPPSSKPPEHGDKEKHSRPCPEPTPVTEETKTEIRQEVVVVEVTAPAGVSQDYLTVPEVLQDTLGRSRVDSVIACTDPRYPLPGYAWVGLEPRFSIQTIGETVRLQRLDCDLEVGADWQPGDSVLTLAVASSMFHITPSDEDHPELILARDVRGGRTYPLLVGLSRTGSLARTARYVLSFQFVNAAAGKAPLLRPGDGVQLQISPSPAAPPTYEMPRFVLVSAGPGSDSTLRLIEKSGSVTGLVPAVQEFELAAFLSVIHRIPQ